MHRIILLKKKSAGALVALGFVGDGAATAPSAVLVCFVCRGDENRVSGGGAVTEILRACVVMVLVMVIVLVVVMVVVKLLYKRIERERTVLEPSSQHG